MRSRFFLGFVLGMAAAPAGWGQSPAWSTYVPRPLPFALEGQLQAGENLQPVVHAVVRLQPDPSAAARSGPPTVSLESLQIPKKARREYDRGEESLRRGKYGEAADHLRRAIEAPVGFPEAWLARGVALRGTGDASGAERALRECLRRDPPNPRARLNLAELCAATGRREEACRLLDDTAALHPAEPDVHLDLGKLLFQAGWLEEAEAEWKKAAALPRAKPEIQLLLARLYLQRRQIAELTLALEEYLRQDPAGPYADEVRTTLASIRKQ